MCFYEKNVSILVSRPVSLSDRMHYYDCNKSDND